MANTTSASLKLTVQQTGENSGTWGQFTNTNLLILEQAIGGYTGVALNATTGATLTFSNGVLSNGKDQVIKLTGTITSNVNVVIPDGVEKTYIVENATSGAFTVTFKTSSGTGPTWSATDKGIKFLFSDGTNVVDVNADLSASTFASISSGQVDILAQAELRLQDTTGGQYVGFKAPGTVASNLTFTLPGADGSSGQALTTNGAGTLSFSTVTPSFSAVGESIIPSTTDTYDLGTPSAVWRNIYTGDLHLNNEHKTEGNFIDGTKGSWTLQEGASDLFVINNKSGEKYKLKLEKI